MKILNISSHNIKLNKKFRKNLLSLNNSGNHNYVRGVLSNIQSLKNNPDIKKSNFKITFKQTGFNVPEYPPSIAYSIKRVNKKAPFKDFFGLLFRKPVVGFEGPIDKPMHVFTTIHEKISLLDSSDLSKLDKR